MEVGCVCEVGLDFVSLEGNFTVIYRLAGWRWIECVVWCDYRGGVRARGVCERTNLLNLPEVRGEVKVHQRGWMTNIIADKRPIDLCELEL